MLKKYKNLSVFRKSRAKKNQPQKGFSLLEVMVAMTIFLVVTGAVYQVLRVALIQRNTVSTRIDATKSARIALNYIRRDAVNAGLSYHNVGGLTPKGFVNKMVGVTTDTDTDDRDLLTGIISGPNVSTNNLNTTPNVKMDSIGFVTRDLAFNNNNPISFTSTGASGSDIVVQTAAGATANSKQFDLYLLETATSQIVGIVTENPTNTSFKLGFGSGVDPLGVNQSGNATGNSRSPLAVSSSGTLKRINLVTYSVTADGVLVRKTYGNNTGALKADQIQTRELIYNVQDFQIKYLLDDGTTSADPTSGNNGRTNQQKMNRVIQMEVTITVMQSNSDILTVAPITIKEVISARNLRYTIS